MQKLKHLKNFDNFIQLESEKQRISSEYQSYREDKDRKVDIISAELSMQQEHCSTQTKQLMAENARLKQELNGEFLLEPRFLEPNFF